MDIYFALQSDSDGTPMTGQAANVTVYLSIDGGSFSASTNAAQEIGRGAYKVTLTSAEAAFNTLLYAPVCTGAQSNIYQLDAAPAIPTASDNAQAVWGAQTKEVTIATAQADTFATASSVANIATVAGAIKAKTDNLPASPAAVGSAMTLTSSTISAVQNGLATGLNIESAVGALELYGDTNWSTANVSGLATTAGLESLATYGDAHWTTADVSGLAEKTDIPTDYAKPTDIPTEDITAIKTKVDSLHNTDLTGVATALSVEKIHAGLFNWSLDEDVINAKNTSGTVIVSSTITRDSSGNITAMEEGND